LGEELGVDPGTVERGAPVARRSTDRLVGDHRVRQVERDYLARLAAADVDPARATRNPSMTGWPTQMGRPT
jgi:hypothetical protein